MESHEILEALSKLVGPGYFSGAVDAVLYGSRQEGRDIDLVLIQPEETATPSLVVGNLDLFLIDKKRFESLARLLDPVATEPLLTGELLAGDRKRWTCFKNEVLSQSPTEECAEHCSRGAVQEYLNARQLFERGVATERTEFFRWAVHTLSFAVSYASFARHYMNAGAKPVTLRELLRADRMCLPEFWSYAQSVRQGTEVHAEAVAHWLREWSKWLVQGGP